MRDLDLRMESDNEPEKVQAVIVSAPTSTAADLAGAHEMLLKDLDEVRRAAQLVAEKIDSLEAKLAPREASLARQSEILERVARESLADANREWAETAQRFRKFVDDMGNAIAWQEQRAKKAADPWRPLLAAMVGALVGGLIVALLTGPVATWLKGGTSGAPPTPTTVAPDLESPAPARGKAPAKGSAR